MNKRAKTSAKIRTHLFVELWGLGVDHESVPHFDGTLWWKVHLAVLQQELDETRVHRQVLAKIGGQV